MKEIVKNSPLMKIALEEYMKFRESEDRDEKYKWDILSKLNRIFPENGITSDNVVEKVELLQKSNPKKGSFVFWQDLGDLQEVAKKKPEVVVDFINSLLDETKPLAERIQQARAKIKRESKKSYGTPLVGYILASFNRQEYPLYKDDILRHFQKVIGDKAFSIPSDIGKKYEKYIEVCKAVAEYLREKGIVKNANVMDGQDFLFCIANYDELKYKIANEIFLNGEKEWYQKDPHSKKTGWIYEKMRKENIEKLSREEFIELFYNYVRDGGEVQSGGYRNVNQFRQMVEEKYEDFREYVMQVFSDDFDVVGWINRLNEFKNWGLGIATIFLHEAKFGKFAIWNNKTKNGLEKIGLWPKRKRGLSDGEFYLKINEVQTKLAGLEERFNLFFVDAMMHYVVEIMSKKTYDNNVNYWKISPGSDAWNWEACREGGFIAIGWDEIGDLRDLSKSEFDAKRDSLMGKHQGWTKQGVEQLWKFAHGIKEGDYVVANHGTNMVLGIGKVTGPYEFVQGIRHGHQIPVEWIDLTHRTIHEGGWRRTLIQLDRIKFEEINNANSVDGKALAEPFATIFMDRAHADWSFDLIFGTIQHIGINDPNDIRFVVTITDKGNTLRLDFCNWAILHFSCIRGKEFRVGMALVENELDLGNDVTKWGPFSNSEIEVRVTELPLGQVIPMSDDLRSTFNDTLAYIRGRFQDWKESNYRKHNKPEIVEAIFDANKRDELFTTGLTLLPQEVQHFWITANPKIWSVDEIRDGGDIFYTAVNEKGNKRRIYGDFLKAKPGDEVIFYESSPVKKVVATGEIVQGFHMELEEGFENEVAGISIKYSGNIDGITWDMISNIPTLQEATPIKNGAQGSLFYLTKEEYEEILALEEISPEATTIKPPETYSTFFDELKVEKLGQEPEIEGLYFEQKESLLAQITTALENGKHIILNGPPGTGKSKLAKEICKFYKGEKGYKMTTATSDWSTFDTIGGLTPDKEKNLEFNKGIFLRCFQDDENKPANKWLIIDEINRADIDKAFGALFSALTGDNITLAQQINGNPIEIIGDSEENDEVQSHKFFIHKDWRIIATMNTFDKASLYEMSYAFMRRFAFINIGVPKDDITKAVGELMNVWGIDDDNYTTNVADLWKIINECRKIGPSIIQDIINYVKEKRDYTAAITMYVLPQFEGLEDKKLKDFVEKLKEQAANELKGELDISVIKSFMEDFFEINFNEMKKNDKDQSNDTS